MKKIGIEIKWALVFALASLAWMLVERLTGLHGEHIDKHATFTNFFAVPAIAVYVFALLDKRKNHYQGTMTYKQGFVSGIIITVIVTMLSPLTQYLTSAFITPDYFTNAIAYVTANGIMSQAEAGQYFSLQNYVVQGLIGAPVMGLVTTGIVAFFTKKHAGAVQ